MSWGEALRALTLLRRDTTSQLAASMEGWDFPASREHLAMLDLFDLTVMANSDPKKGKPQSHSGRPFKIDTREVVHRGNAGGRTRAEVIEILDRARNGLPMV